MVKIKTKRLVLRPVATEDANDIIATLNDFEVSKCLSTVPFPYSQADAVEWMGMQSTTHDPVNTNFSVYLHSGEYCGAVGFCQGKTAPELGFYLSRRHWGNGYITEASSAAIHWLFEMTDESKITSGAYTFNPASLAVQAKLGFVQTGTKDKMSNSQGKVLPLITTLLNRTDFKPL